MLPGRTEIQSDLAAEAEKLKHEWDENERREQARRNRPSRTIKLPKLGIAVQLLGIAMIIVAWFFPGVMNWLGYTDRLAFAFFGGVFFTIPYYAWVLALLGLIVGLSFLHDNGIIYTPGIGRSEWSASNLDFFHWLIGLGIIALGFALYALIADKNEE